MKVTITTLTGEKHDLEVAPHDGVRNVKRLLYESIGATGQVRLLQGLTVLEDDRKLSEYSLQEGTMISALFEPDLDINIGISMGSDVHSIMVPNSTSVMALKVKICGVLRCGVTPEKLEIRLGDVTLENPMPLHFYGINDGTTLQLLKPYVTVTILNNQGATLFWRLYRKDTIREVKAKLATAKWMSTMRFYFYEQPSSQRVGGRRAIQSNFDEIRGMEDGVSVEGMRLYLITEEKEFHELDNDENVENCKIENDDNLYVLSYRWSFSSCTVTMTKNGKKIQGVEEEDTCLAIKLRAQDQFGIPISELLLFQQQRNSSEYWYMNRGRQKNGIPDEEKPCHERKKIASYGVSYQKMSPLAVITSEELQTEGRKIEEQQEERRRKAMEAAAAQRGITVEELEAEQARRAEEARLEREKKQIPTKK